MYELFVLYAPLLRDQARRMSVPRDERDHLVDTFLDDVVIHLVEAEIPPRELTTYIVSALRNRVRTRYRDVARGRQAGENASSEYGQSTERIVAECHSEYGMRSASTLDTEDATALRSAIKKFADTCASGLSREELTLMVGIGRHIPLRDLAEQLGVSHGAIRVRVCRLRERFIRLASQYVSTLENSERSELERFFRRAEIPFEKPSGTQTNERRDRVQDRPPSPE